MMESGLKPELWTTIEPGQDVALVVCDMDGTLLDGEGRVPNAFWSLVDTMSERGIMFAPASGRQYATLAKMFAGRASIRTFISENGAHVVQDGESVSVTPVEKDTAERVIRLVRDVDHRDIGLVAGGAKSAYVERRDDRFTEQVETYNAALTIVDDLTEVEDDFVKLATFDFNGVDDIVEDVFPGSWDGHQVVVSGTHWVDIISDQANKGNALRDLQKHLGISPSQTVVFGDYLNDLEMLDQADLSFAMANAHPDVRAAARYEAPANTEHGVVSVLERLLNL